ncbi:MAG: amidinotransferase [SAR324 cluster bacterium]|nr:amidinotransferase [SAR324 cluster bacterium]
MNSDDKCKADPFDSAYGGSGWAPRIRSLKQEKGQFWSHFGINSEWKRLRSVLLHRPGKELAASIDPQKVQMLAALNVPKAQTQHASIGEAYQNAGVTVHYVDPPITPSPNQMFIADLMFMTPEGAILARPASEVRAGEERWVSRRLADIGIPILRSISGKGVFEGADAMWLDKNSVMLARGLRSNEEAVEQIRETLERMNVSSTLVDLPFGTMHLMGMLRIVDRDLAIAWPKRLSHRAVEALRNRGYRVAWLPEGSEANQNKAFNFVTLGPREILMSANCPQTQTFYESQGIRCHTVAVDELAKAAGGIGCLSGILERETE